MLDKEKTVQSPSKGNDQAGGRPEPPNDLWEQLDRIIADAGEPPENSFTAASFAKKYKVSDRTAYVKVKHLLEQGLIVEVGRVKGTRYFRVIGA